MSRNHRVRHSIGNCSCSLIASLAQLLRVHTLGVGLFAKDLPSLSFKFGRVVSLLFLHILNLNLLSFCFSHQLLLDPADLLSVFLLKQLPNHVVFQVVTLKRLR